MERVDVNLKTPLRALILEDRPADAELMAYELSRSGFELQWQRVDTEPDFLAHLTPRPDVILADYTMPELDASQALHLLQENGLNIPFIVVSGTIGEDVAVDIMRQGAADYLLKDRLVRLGPAVRGALVVNDLRRQKGRAEDDLQASEIRFDAFMRHSPALAFIKDELGRIIYVNSASSHGEEIASQLQDYAPVFENGEYSRTIEEVATASGDVRQMLCFRFLFNDATGRRLLGGVSVDITEQKAAERSLSQALAGKDVLLREVHHRVKNNLQTISSLLNMQAELLPDVTARQALLVAQQRVHSMALIHEQMCGSQGMEEVDFSAYTRRLARYLFDSFEAEARQVRLRLALDPVSLAMDQMIPCGLILNELIANSLKHGFPGERGGEILVSLRCEDGRTVAMGVADNGIGLPDSGGTRLESLGMRIVGILTRQLGGSLVRQSAGGLSSTVTFTRFSKVDRLNPSPP
ncbi:MAG: histidine kinase dimerization/phosphoacceptor domain -containing protein [Bryobacteraceae bacterium]|jgi:two-component sensor histidine kinase/AmiR/NasT family two-component response regulator